MNTTIKILSFTALCWAIDAAQAQQPPPSAAPSATAAEAASSAQVPAAAPASKTAKTTALSEAGEPRANTSSAAGAGRPAAAPGQKKAADRTDRLELGTATVTGDREQPKVMYIVPWKKSDIGDLAGKPMNSLVDEILAPVDRDVFKREVLYYKAVQADASQNGAQQRPSQQGEK
jgi:hypothetical protein